MHNFNEGKDHRRKVIVHRTFHKRKSKLEPSSDDDEEKQKNCHASINIKTKRILTPIKYSKINKNLLPIQDLLKINSYKKEKENERKRQYLLNKIMHNYAKEVPSNYYIMVISNILSNKLNKIKSHFTELLNLIETKELLSNYFLKKESHIKLTYLTKLFAKNIRIFPNYIKNEEIYNIMTNYLIEKEKLILRIERNKRVDLLKIKLLNYKNNEGSSENEKVKKAIDSLTESENIDLNNLNESSISYSFGKNNDSIKKVKIIIDDISIFLNNYDKDNDKININKNGINKNKENIKNRKININIKKLNDLNIKDDNKYNSKNFILTNRKIIKPFLLNKNKTFKDINFSNLSQKNKKNIKVQVNNNEKDNSKDIKYNYKITEKLLPNSIKEKFQNNIHLETNTNKTKFPLTLNISNNILLNTSKNICNTINNINSIKRKIIIPSTFRKNSFKSTTKFLNYIHQNEKIIGKRKIKNSIIDFVKKFGITKNQSVTIKQNKNFKKVNKVQFSLSLPNTRMNLISKKSLPLEANKNLKNENILRIIHKTDSGYRSILPNKSKSFKKKEYNYFYLDMFNSTKKQNYWRYQAKSERVESI